MDVEVMSPNGLHKRENSASAAHSTSGGLVPMQPDMKENESKNSRNIHDPNSAIHYKIFRRCFACTCMCNGCCNIAADSGITKPKDSSSVDLHHLQQQGSSTINCDGDFTTDDSSRDSDSFPTSTVNVRTAPLGNEGRIRSASVREEEEEDLLGFNNALFWLGLLTVLISILSDAISSSIEEAAEDTNMSGIFLAAIVLPIVGNAAEHASAISFAMRNKMDIALAVAVGSSTQIALCVLPLLVIIGWGAGLDMSLNFGAYESSMLLLCVIAVTFAIKDGTSNWLLGLSMIVAYCIIAIGFYAHRNDTLK